MFRIEINNFLIDLANFDICSATIRSLDDTCIAQTCYFGTCEEYVLDNNITKSIQKNNSENVLSRLRSSFAQMNWTSIVSSGRTRIESLINRLEITRRCFILIILLIVNITLTMIGLSVVLKSIKQAKHIAGRKSYRYTLL